MATTTLQKSLDASIDVLRSFGILPAEDESSRLGDLLQELVEVDPGNVTAIARVMEYMGSFNELVRSEIKDIRITDRYERITGLFDSIVSDAKSMIGQLDDGVIDTKERISNLWMKLVRGGIPKRFDKIEKIYKDVATDTASHLQRERRILEAYMEFRGAIKEAEAIAYKVMEGQKKRLDEARKAFEAAAGELDGAGADPGQKAQLQLRRDQLQHRVGEEEKRFHFVTDLAEHLKVSYNVGDTVMAKLQQTHDAKDQVHKRSAVFFGTNEHVFTALAATYTSQLGLHEATQTLNSMKEGVNRSLETLAEVSGKLEDQAIEAAHGPTVRAEALKKLVDAVVEYQENSRRKIRECRDASAKNAQEIERIVDDAKERARKALVNHEAA